MKNIKTKIVKLATIALYLGLLICFVWYCWAVLVSYTTNTLESLIIVANRPNFRATRLLELPIDRMIIKVAKAYEIDPGQFLKIAQCENGTHQPYRKNYAWPQISASGLFMFTDSTWIATRALMGFPDPNLAFKHDAIENAKTAAWKIANGGIGAWDASKNCWG